MDYFRYDGYSGDGEPNDHLLDEGDEELDLDYDEEMDENVPSAHEVADAVNANPPAESVSKSIYSGLLFSSFCSIVFCCFFTPYIFRVIILRVSLGSVLFYAVSLRQ